MKNVRAGEIALYLNGNYGYNASAFNFSAAGKVGPNSMMKRIFSGLMLWIAILAGIVVAWPPKPSAIEKDGQWTLDVTYEHPMQISITLPGREGPQRFWYMIFSLTNATFQEEAPFYPKPELVTDTFQILPAGRGVQKALFDLVKRKHQGKYPFLESLDFSDNRIRRGNDNTRDFVIFWPDFDPKAKEVQFYLAGLSNEATAINHPVSKDDMGNPFQVCLQKTLQVTYGIGADPQLRQDAILKFKNQNWVMR